jgi:hypothetical protein
VTKRIEDIPILDNKHLVFEEEDKPSPAGRQDIIVSVVEISASGEVILRHDQLRESEKALAFTSLCQHLSKCQPAGRWTIAHNGPGNCSAFRLHGIILK